jgi:hypothetical protein
MKQIPIESIATVIRALDTGAIQDRIAAAVLLHNLPDAAAHTPQPRPSEALIKGEYLHRSKVKEINMKSTIDQAVDRFLCWKLPADFAPDCGITFTSPIGCWPTGTNLFTADQAEAMLNYVAYPLTARIVELEQQLADAHRDWRNPRAYVGLDIS